MAAGKLIHILGGGAWQVPTIRLARNLGYRTLVTDMYVERPGYALADTYEVVDITDLEGTLEVARRHRIDGIICDTTDVGVPTMAYVAEKMGLPGIGYSTALNFTNKHRMRTLCRAAGVPSPEFELVRSLNEMKLAADRIGLPVVIKPVDSQSSRGVHAIRQVEEAEALWADALGWSRARAVIVESFLDGVEVTVESVCLDHEVFIVGVSEKDHFRHRPEVACRLTYPANQPQPVFDRIRSVNAMAVRALGLRTGVTHGEYMVVAGEVYLVEIAARGAGSCVFSHIVPYLAGIPVPQLYLAFMLGEAWTTRPLHLSRAANLAFFDFPRGRVKSIRGAEQARREPAVQELLLEFGPGDTLSPPIDDRSRQGLVVVFGETRQEVLEITERVFRTVEVDLE
jgi:biotin carboxylase